MGSNSNIEASVSTLSRNYTVIKLNQYVYQYIINIQKKSTTFWAKYRTLIMFSVLKVRIE